MRRAARLRLQIAAIVVALLAIVVVTFFLTLSSPWFHEKIRQRIVAELEQATGGTAVLGDWVFNWKLMTLQFNELTLHGTEPAGVPPLLQTRSIQVGLKIISFWKQNVDIASLTVSEPRVNIILGPDGSTNIPSPKIKTASGKIGFEPILDWKIGKFALENGTVLLGENKHKLNVHAEKLNAQFSYDRTGPRYKGQLSMQPLRVTGPRFAPVDMGVYLLLGLEKNRIEVTNAKFDIRRSHIDAHGAIENLADPKGVFQFTAQVAVDHGVPFLPIVEAHRGIVDLAGTAIYNGASDYTVTSSAKIRGLEVEIEGVRASDIRVTATARLNPQGLKVSPVAADVLGGRFNGTVDLPELKRFVIDGAISDMPIQQALGAWGSQLSAAAKTNWSGSASGPIRVEGGLHGGPVIITMKFGVAPTPGGIPAQGTIDARYDSGAKTLAFGPTSIETPGVHLDVAGVLGEQLQTHLTTTNLDELLPAINLITKQPVNSLPVRLKNGQATFDGTVTGKLNSPEIAGAVESAGFTYAGIDFDALTSQVKVNESSLTAQDATVTRGSAKVLVSGSLGLNDWSPEGGSPIAATAKLSGADISELLSLAGQKQIPVQGALAASAQLSGTVDNPRGSAEVTLSKGVAYDEPFDRLQANVEYSPQAIGASQFKLTAGPAQITGSASFEPTRPFNGAPELRDGRVQFQLATNDMAVQRFQNVKKRRPDMSGMLRASLQGAATVHPQAGRPLEALLTSLTGDVTTQDLRLEGRSIGNIKAVAKTEASVLKVQLDSNFLNSTVVATGQWRLTPGYPGEASAKFSQVSLGTIRDWLAKPGERSSLNFDGSAEGSVSIAGPALDPRGWKASAQLTKFEIHPIQQGTTSTAASRFTLRNEGPIVVALEKSTVTVTSAHFTGPASDIHVTGVALLEPKPSLDLRVNGQVDLALAQTFTTDLETGGAMTINASIRGALAQPVVNGRLEVSRGSLHFADITAGLSAASGVILFSGNQATIQNFTGTVGGGRIGVTGVVGYAGGELSYRVDTTAKDVRVRYPEGASTSANAELSLRGTTQRSTVSGTITVTRTGFNPRTDFSSILGKASEPVRTPSARVGPLAGMHFDVRIETAPDISFESSLTQDLQVEGNLRLQGTPYNPVLLGRLNITQGELNFFGTQYTVNQGSVTFANPVKMEPVLNIDLQTRVQGIDVILTISGPINKLNVTPRSDPPLEFSQVLALLATGSAPTSDPTLAARQNNIVTNQSITQLGASALIGQVVANPVSSRLQRFFGVSRLKIDPQLTGVENNPQARLTLEQQVSKDLTLTYITNLTSSSQQIVRVEWSLNRKFSVIAVRDENGLFGLDFLFKKSFK